MGQQGRKRSSASRIRLTFGADRFSDSRPLTTAEVRKLSPVDHPAASRYIQRSGIYVYVYSQNSANFFGVAAISSIENSGVMNSPAGLTQVQAYAIDAKIDDGLPQSGAVTAMYVNGGGPAFWVSPNSAPGVPVASAPWVCYDNAVSGAASHSSLTQNTPVCALSFQFQ
jgi:hypothetical protein